MALDDAPTGVPEDERAIAVRLFNDTWALLEREDRTPREDDRMVHMAHASRFHWDNVGTDSNRAIGEWQISRVYAAIGNGPSALHHALRAIGYAEDPGVEPWVLASAYEGLARARVTAGDAQSAREARAKALDLLSSVDDEEDRAIVAADIDSLPI